MSIIRHVYELRTDHEHRSYVLSAETGAPVLAFPMDQPAMNKESAYERSATHLRNLAARLDLHSELIYVGEDGRYGERRTFGADPERSPG